MEQSVFDFQPRVPTRMEAVERALAFFQGRGGFTGREFEEKVEELLGFKLTGETPLREARIIRAAGKFNFRCVKRSESRYEFLT